MDKEKSVDESWKQNAASEKQDNEAPQESQDQSDQIPEANFVNYVSSLSFQTLIFLGELPSPLTNKTEKNYPQAKFIIDTLAMMKEKTQGNLTPEESQLIEGSVYELQMKYVEHIKKEEQDKTQS